MSSIARAIGAFIGLRRFKALGPEERSLVFYAEGRADWAHLGPIVDELTGRLGRHVVYVTSDEDDPVRAIDNPLLRCFYVGEGSARTAFFRLIEAKVLVMTLPDLESFHLKRSVHPVHYVYVFHSMVSSHMIYRKAAFDAYDTVLCVGPHHVAEIRRTEEVYGLPPKQLVEHGYGRLDLILRSVAERGPFEPSGDRGMGRRILLAPSWGECSFIEAPVGVELIELLLEAGHQLVLRLHPMTVRRHPRLASQVTDRFSGRDFRVDTDMNSQESLHASDLMISDWSGAALEYAFGLERPVLFIDMPRKVNNPDYELIRLVALEDSLRTDVGEVVHPSDLGSVLGRIEAMTADPEAFRDRLREIRQRTVYNVGRSASVGAAYLARLVDAPRENPPPRTIR